MAFGVAADGDTNLEKSWRSEQARLEQSDHVFEIIGAP